MKKKIVITGVTSALLSRLVSLIDVNKYHIIGITRKEVVPGLLNGVEIVTLDLANMNQADYLLDNCYMVIHGAAITHSKRTKDYYTVNYKYTKTLVDMANKHKVNHFVFISSNTAGKNSGGYGLSKLKAEEAVKTFFKKYYIFRLSEVFGLNKQEGIEKLIDDTLYRAIVLCPLGIPTKLYPIHLDDAAEQMYSHVFMQESENKTILINGEKGYSFYEVIELVMQLSKRRVRILFIPKWGMFLIKYISYMIPFDIGFVPDQVDRLYVKKKIEPKKGLKKSLFKYISSLL